jgi:peptidoglycan/xylan/chitin deacetylase (PgdA/CDA1 family)
MAAVAALFLVTAAPTNASALDKNQIVQMSKLGIPAESIEGAIDKAGDDFKLTQEDLQDLRDQGVSEDIITYLKEQGHVAGAKKAEGEDGEEGDQQKQAAEDGEDDDGGAAPAPEPAPGEDEDKMLTQEEAEELAEQRMQEQKAEERRQRKLQAAARSFPDAARAIENGQNMEAARMYLKFLSIGPDQGTENWYKAKFGLAKALFNEGILSGAATPTRQVVMAGANRPHFEEAFRMLEALTARIGYQPPALRDLTQVLVRDLPKGFQYDFNYYVGKYFYDYNNNEVAIEYLDKVNEGSEDYPRAQYLKGVANLAGSVDNKPEALRAFERAIRAGEEQGIADNEIFQLSYMALARVFYEVGLYDVALYYYQKIPRDSSRHAEALFEQAWSYFVKNDYKRALGTFHTLHSPYYDEWYFPDLYILESTVYLNLCRYDYSKQALAKFQKEYLDKRPRLQKFLNETNEPKAYWNKLTGAYDKDGIARSGTVPKMFVNAVLNDLEFFNIYKQIQTLQNEKDALQANIDELGDFGQEVLDRVNNQLDTKVNEGGILVRQKLSQIDQELQNWETKATQISFDIDSEERSQLEQELQNKEAKQTQDQGTTLMVVADDWQRWPFEGEYWFDEVANYRSQQSSQCIDQ